jgi:apolipoprotein N-acyltransferase
MDRLKAVAAAASETMRSNTFANMAINALIVLTGAVVAIVSFAFLIPLDSVQAATGVTVILGVSYALSILAWVAVMFYYSSDSQNLVWLLTHLVFLVMFPATIAATAMNVTAIQNTRNLLAGKISA